MTYRAVLIGFGSIAESTHLAALAACGVEVVAIVEPHPARQAVARRIKPTAEVYATVLEALDNTRLDFADICTPPDLHYDAAVTCLNGGLHVLCEKPLATDLTHTERLYALSQARGLVLACMHNWTQAPIFLDALNCVREKKLGALRELKLLTLRTQPAGVAAGKENWRTDPRRAGGGISYDHGWHGLSIMFRAFGATPTWVEGTTTRERFFDLGVEDTVRAHLGFGSGNVGYYEASWAGDKRSNEATYLFDQGSIQIVNDTLHVVRDGVVTETREFTESLAGGGYRPQWTAGLVREFLDEIETPKKRGALAREARNVQAALIDIHRSHDLLGQRVTCEPMAPQASSLAGKLKVAG